MPFLSLGRLRFECLGFSHEIVDSNPSLSDERQYEVRGQAHGSVKYGKYGFPYLTFTSFQ